MRSDSVQTHDILLSTDHSIITNKSDSHSTLLADNHHRHYCHHDHHEGIIRCPHHVALPDSDWIPSTDNVSLNLRNSYQVNTIHIFCIAFYRVCVYHIQLIANHGSRPIKLPYNTIKAMTRVKKK